MKSYSHVIDLTGRKPEPQHASGEPFLKEPEPSLPEARTDTLPAPLRAGLDAAGWNDLMPVQAKSIPYILEGRDLIVQSRTGSGKTGAFLLPLLALLDPDTRATQALILAPTRELALQVEREFDTLKRGSTKTQPLESVAVYGGVGYKQQIAAFRRGAQLVVGTPGRILDHLERKTLDLKDLRVLVLDEADEMLSMGFFPDMRKLRRYLPADRRSYMYSATIPYKVRRLGEDFLRDPGFLSLSEGHVHIDTMAHWYYVVPPMEKDDVLRRLIELQNPDSAIIFTNTKKKVDYLAQVLRNFGYDAEPISGDLKQSAREKVMGLIRTGELRFLVATDIAARGIDISDLSHVFMYDVPQDPEYYVHRAGRTARAGKTGIALTLTTLLDRASLLGIARKYDIQLEKQENPTEEDVEARVAERSILLLEDALRERHPDERARFEQLADLARTLVADGRELLLALLIDAFYHEQMHERREGGERERRESETESLAEGQLVERLESLLGNKLNLQVQRLRRFAPLARKIATREEESAESGEPELLGMLLDDFLRGRLRVQTPRPAAPAAPAAKPGPGGPPRRHGRRRR